MSVIPLLAASGTIFLDARAHKTIYDGCQVARARGAAVKRFRFEDPDHLDELLRAERDPTRLVCMDGVNSMTGNAPDIRAFAARRARARRAALRRRRARLRRHRRAPRRTRRAPTARAATASSATAARPTTTSCSSAGFSKAYSSLLAFIACPTEVKDLLKVAAPPYLYSGPSPVASLATVLAGFDVNERRGDELRARAATRTRRACSTASTRLGVHTPNRSGFPIIEIPLRDHDAHRRRRPAAVRPRRLRDARGLPARAQGRGRLPRPGHRGQHRRRDRHADRGARGARRRAASCAPSTTRPRRRRTRRPDDAPRGRRGVRAAAALAASTSPSARCSAALYVLVPPFAGSGPVFNLLGALAGRRDPRRRPPATGPASPAPWLLVRGRLPALLARRPLHLQLPAAARHARCRSRRSATASTSLVYPALMAGPADARPAPQPASATAPALIDSLIMTLGLALLSWVALIAAVRCTTTTLDAVAKLVSIAYPLGDILLLAAAIRLAVDTGNAPAGVLPARREHRRPARRPTSPTALVTLARRLRRPGLARRRLDQLLPAVGRRGAAPVDARARAAPRPSATPRLTPLRLALLTVRVADRAGRGARAGHRPRRRSTSSSSSPRSLPLRASSSPRMAGLVRQQERSVARERDPQRRRRRRSSPPPAARRSATPRSPPRARSPATTSSARLCLVEDGDCASSPPTASSSAAWHARRPRPPHALLAPPRRGAAASRLPRDACARTSRLPATQRHALVLALSVRGETRGAARRSPARAIAAGRCSSSAAPRWRPQVSLALESAALTEEVHRRDERGALRLARAALQRPHHRARRRRRRSSTRARRSSASSATRPRSSSARRFDRLLHAGRGGRASPHVLADGAAHAGRETEALECALRHRDGSRAPVRGPLHRTCSTTRTSRGIVLNSRDVSERKAFEEQLAHQAFHDPVTGPRQPRAVRRARAPRGRRARGASAARLAVIFIDLDDFKTINDSLGHAAGDAGAARGRRAPGRAASAPSDTAARFGGDEFAVLLEDVARRAGRGRHRRAHPRVARRSRCVVEQQGALRPLQPRHLGRRGRRRRPTPTS